MSPASVRWRPNLLPNGAVTSAARTASLPVASRSGYVRFAYLVGTALVFLMLAGFYSVVSGAVRRADEGRQTARADADRKAICATFAGPPMRERCGPTLAHNAPPNAVLKVADVQPVWIGRRTELTARAD